MQVTYALLSTARRFRLKQAVPTLSHPAQLTSFCASPLQLYKPPKMAAVHYDDEPGASKKRRQQARHNRPSALSARAEHAAMARVFAEIAGRGRHAEHAACDALPPKALLFHLCLLLPPFNFLSDLLHHLNLV
eukprot:4830908-Pleurochrysis_carterae.AAC.1